MQEELVLDSVYTICALKMNARRPSFRQCLHDLIYGLLVGGLNRRRIFKIVNIHAMEGGVSKLMVGVRRYDQCWEFMVSLYRIG